MKAFQLDSSNSWKYLPWNQIRERVFILQIQIYEASKSCNDKLIYKTQNILVNSNEAKILAIEEIFQSLFVNSLHHNKNYYELNDQEKYLIFYSLFKQQKLNLNLAVLTEKIKQYLIYLCLQPEWEAKFEPGLQCNINTLGSYLFQEKLLRFLNYTLIYSKNCSGMYFHYQINNKYINPKYIIKKIQTGNYLNYCLKFWLNNNYIQFDQDFKLSFKLNLLCQLLHRIMLNGIEWFYSMVHEFYSKGRQYDIYKNLFVSCEVNTNRWIFTDCTFINTFTFILKFLGLNTNKLSNPNSKYIDKSYDFNFSYIYSRNLDKINSSSLIVLPTVKTVNNICKPLFLSIKSLLHNKDLLNRLRANKNINISKATLKINKLTLQFYSDYSLFLPLKIIKNIYRKIDFIIYSWIKKRNRNKKMSKLIIYKNKIYLMRNLLKFNLCVKSNLCIEKLNRK